MEQILHLGRLACDQQTTNNQVSIARWAMETPANHNPDCKGVHKMIISKHTPGTFCWVELGTTDQDAAKKFYVELFGWSVNDFPMGPDGVYTMFQLNGNDVGAAYKLGEEQLSLGIPPNWGLYISVEDVDATAKAITSAGGKLMMEPFDVFEFGRMVVAQDPAGATFSIWQPRNHIGVSVMNQSNSMCWQELATSDLDGAKTFYSTVFGWDPQTKETGPMEYTEIHTKDQPGQAFAGMYTMTPEMQGVPPHWMVYFAVDDCDGSVDKAKSLGAQVRVPPMDIPGVGRFSVLADPQGAAFAVIKLNYPS